MFCPFLQFLTENLSSPVMGFYIVQNGLRFTLHIYEDNNND